MLEKGIQTISLKCGNIITFQRPDGEVITHRIEKIITSDLQNAYVTKGDNNDQDDETVVTYDMIIGKVVYTMPRFGKVVKLLKNKVFFTFALIVLVLILMYDKKIMDRKKERKEIREKYEKKSDFYF